MLYFTISVEQKPQNVTYKSNQAAEQANSATSNLAQLVDLPEVFEYLGLSKYTDVFVHQEVKLNKLLNFVPFFFGLNVIQDHYGDFAHNHDPVLFWVSHPPTLLNRKIIKLRFRLTCRRSFRSLMAI